MKGKRKKALTFAEESFVVNNNVAIFMTGGETRPIKKFESGKKYDLDYNTFVNFIISGKYFGKNKGSHFIELICWTVEHIVSQSTQFIQSTTGQKKCGGNF